MKPSTLPTFDAFCEQYYTLIQRWAIGKTHNVQIGEDITQDTFIKAGTYYHTLTHDTNLKSWLFRIASSVLVDHFRTAYVRLVSSLEAMEYDTFKSRDMIIQSDERLDLRAILDRLSPYERNLLLLTYGHGYKSYEAAILLERKSVHSTHKERHIVRHKFLAMYHEQVRELEAV